MKRASSKGRPVLRMCYLCGQQFGSTSIGIHVPQCYGKKLAQWEKGDPKMRGPKPKHPDTVDWQGGKGSTVEELNEMQYKEYGKNMVPCPNCARTFLPDRLPVHMRGCKAPAGAKKPPASPSAKGSQKSTTPRKGRSPSTGRSSGLPPTLPFCYLCGRQFGSTSIGIHVPQCYEKKLAQWENSDPYTRGAKPKHPDTVNWKPSDTVSTQEQSEAQFKEFVSNLAECPNCARKFLPDRLVVHLRSCRPGNAAKAVKPAPPKREEEPAETKEKEKEKEEPDEAARLNPKKNRVPKNSSMEADGRACPHCSTVEYDTGARFCRECGWNLNSKNMPDPCTECGQPIPDESRFCPTCGHMVKGAQKEERAKGGENVNAPTVHLVTCSACEAVCDADANFCDNCGAVLDMDPAASKEGSTKKAAGGKEVMFCSSCKETYDDLTAVFCEECGTKLEKLDNIPEEAPSAGKSTLPPGTKRPPKTTTTKKSVAKPTPPPFDAGVAAGGEYEDLSRQECPKCGRKFASEAYERHVGICKGDNGKQRKTFNAAKQRRTSELAEVPKTKNPKLPPKKDFRAESEAFRRALREARNASNVLKAGGTAKDLPPPTYSENPDYKQCPHCKRRFAPDVAQRHIPSCANTVNRPKPPPKRR
ncbi:hypothetical protein AGDE_07926 [Angomonas deanei]|nr:hypothetical protein AGDE_07926 [Angomonas deanei]|eukprot:EPY34417.1 hypothetical protein AGDE_07926 [Angomonas deanei]